MKAIIFDGYGQQPRLVEQPTPTPQAAEVLVRVRATSVNPLDWKQVSGKFRPIVSASFPFVPGYDL
jgi:NADPH:quinone reductase-like Zn-dependent oxidoreductase